ncbi:MAG: L-threonylcarbamoyladenylate synthase [Anaerolineales bacterium]|jgi:L-threonylcarbamoyladenylate synthase|nr:threonylcarbamoyl-AMP synthase [Anaerolineae bacterium]MCZ7549981.1 L-threonylcarbamoyladenylate synthase [Anaerolineales bacterium]MDL1926962.1 threonylcarbamoyl-AMP synthase [Anaerolineae bacterium AMX1]OQY86294.1 MAG: threonylcarbamoyl-AMP synthase [Anaerolineae bacterium UTCFX3]GER80613.1 threonylcarbamoyl-AMP synthase [Candidatus Denitrolinea symbiosum]
MKTEILPADDPLSIARALEILRAGGLVVFPTDTVYGLGSLAFDQAAIESIYAVKGRPLEKAIPILIADAADLDRLARAVTDLARRLASRFWPGPLTLVLPKRADLPAAVSAADTVGVRVPDHAAARALLRAAGPMAVTSANLSGRSSPRSAEEAASQLGGRVPLVLDGGETPGGVPSTVVDVSGSVPVILREGPLTLAEINSI